MKVKCGDANPNGNVYLLYKGGCGKELEMKDAYRCTGCGGWFHRDCIFQHFEEEKNHDYSRSALKRIRDYAVNLTGKHKKEIISIADEGLKRLPIAKLKDLFKI